MGDTQGKTGGRIHSVTLDQRRRAVITGINDVCSFHENEIVLKVDSGTMIITGENLHVGKLVLEEGKLDIEGHLDGIRYEAPHAAGRLFRFIKRS